MQVLLAVTFGKHSTGGEIVQVMVTFFCYISHLYKMRIFHLS